MKKSLQLILILGLAALATGCASTGGYFVDRGRDAADILTLGVGAGLGVSARVGPIAVAPFSCHYDRYAIRGGTPEILSHNSTNSATGGMLWWFGETHEPSAACFSTPAAAGEHIVRERGKAYSAWPLGVVLWGEPFFFTTPFLAVPESRGTGRQALPYYSQCEITVGMLASFRLGFNPGELLDFILGWTTIDIYNDDLEKRKKIEQNTAH